jgi:hypothetical protein
MGLSFVSATFFLLPLLLHFLQLWEASTAAAIAAKAPKPISGQSVLKLIPTSSFLQRLDGEGNVALPCLKLVNVGKLMPFQRNPGEHLVRFLVLNQKSPKRHKRPDISVARTFFHDFDTKLTF